MKRMMVAVLLVIAHWSYASEGIEKMNTLTCVNNTGFDVQLEVCGVWNSRCCGVAKERRSGLVTSPKGSTVRFAIEDSMTYFKLFANEHTVGGKGKKSRLQIDHDHSVTILPFDKKQGYFDCEHSS